jgi:hypothetical protein
VQTRPFCASQSANPTICQDRLGTNIARFCESFAQKRDLFLAAGIFDAIKAVPDHPLWSIMGPAFQRATLCFKVLNMADILKKIAAEVVEEGVPPPQ